MRKIFSAICVSLSLILMIGVFSSPAVCGASEGYALGDVDKDGKLSVSDVVALRQKIVSGDAAEEVLALGDMDKDGKLRVSDIVLLREKIIKQNENDPLVVRIDEGNFPDPVFIRDVRKFDLNGDGWLSEGEIAKVEEIDISIKEIITAEYPKPPQRPKVYTLQGITYFTALKALNCSGNALSELDISQNASLTTLYCANNNLTELDVSHNKRLTTLYCYDNNLNNLDVTCNTNLLYLLCYNNNLSTLNVTRNAKLLRLECDNNNLTALDVTQNTKLDTLLCENNNITTLDVSNNPLLSQFTYDDNVQVIGWNK